ncbi:MAG: hypothetical protein JW891_18455 [Candidatus Lokiarchaeota archaeon]|nr:hypothetical protein [Candidatus Lokiarchaeota archaeon]
MIEKKEAKERKAIRSNLLPSKRSKYSLNKAGQELYEFVLFQYLKSDVEELRLSAAYESLAIEIYRDALKEQVDFSSFYKKLSVKEPKVVSAALVYISIQVKGIYISFPKFLEHFNQPVSRSSIGQGQASLFRMLIRLEKYKILYEFSSFALLKDNYDESVEALINIYGDRLCAKDILSQKEIASIISFFRTNKRFFERKNTSHYLKNPKNAAAISCYAYLLFEKDLEIPLVDFSNSIEFRLRSRLDETLSESKTTYQNAPDTLRSAKPEFVRLYYKEDLENYKRKVSYWIVHFVQLLKDWIFSKSIPSKDLELVRECLNGEFVRECELLFDSVVDRGFKPSYWGKNDIFYYYTPKMAALSVVYRSCRIQKHLQTLVNKATCKALEEEGLILKHERISSDYIWRNDNWLHDKLRDLVKTKNQRYTRPYFTSLCKRLLRRFYHEETDFLLQLYSKTDLEPQEFAEKLNIYGRTITWLVRLMETHNKFTEARVFHAIRRFIESHIPKESKNGFLAWLKKMQQTRCTYLRHNHFCYQFKYDLSKVDSLPGLKSYLNDIYEGNFPRALFGDPNSLGISDLKFTGSKTEPITAISVKAYFKDIVRESHSHELIGLTRAVFKQFKESKMGRKPDHPTVQAHLLRYHENTLAIEVPVWLNAVDGRKAFRGHIALLLIKKNTLMVVDYKRDKSEMFKCIPQVTAYALVLQYRLEQLSKTSFEYKCASFSKDHYIEWDLASALEKIVEYTKLQDASRNTPLTYSNSSVNLNLTSVLDSLKQSLKYDKVNDSKKIEV